MHNDSSIDKTVYFFDIAKKMMHNAKINEDLNITPENIYQIAHKANRDTFLEVMKVGHLPGSTILGAENIKKLYSLAKEGKSCLVMSEHVSNLDVPSMFARFYDHGDPDLKEIFEKIIFIAGVKLNENPLVKLFTEMFSRIVNVPPSTMSKLTSKEEIDLASKINRAALRKLVELRKAGYIFILYPTMTRYRPWKPETKKGVKESTSYLNSFDYFCCCSINGNNMPPKNHEDMTREPFLQDVLVFNFGEVKEAKSYIKSITDSQITFNPEDKENIKQFVIDKIMEEISILHDKAEEYRDLKKK